MDIHIGPDGDPIQRGYYQKSRSFYRDALGPSERGVSDDFMISLTDTPGAGCLAEFCIEIHDDVEAFKVCIYSDAIGLASKMCGDLFEALARAADQNAHDAKAVRAVLDSLGFHDWTRTVAPDYGDAAWRAAPLDEEHYAVLGPGPDGHTAQFARVADRELAEAFARAGEAVTARRQDRGR